MKSFIIYVKGHKSSEKQANTVKVSCNKSGFDAELLEGVTPDTLNQYEEYPDAKNSRICDFKKENMKIYNTKKACFTNHIRIWKKCLELNEPVVFLEQDVGNVRKWDNTSFNEILILNADSAFKQSVFDHVENKPWLRKGCCKYDNSPLIYRHNNQWKGSRMIPGTGSYAVTPKGAKRLLKKLETYGWEQSDFFINSYNVDLEYIIPEYFNFKSDNLNMSHSISWLSK